MKEETLHYILRFLKSNHSSDPRHAVAVEEMRAIQESLIDNYSENVLARIEQPKLVQLLVKKSRRVVARQR